MKQLRRFIVDDIVTQLREIRWEWDKTWVDKMKDAADEIERLRDEISKQTCCQDAADEIEPLQELVSLLKHSIEHQVCECSHCLSEEGAT